MQPSDNDDWSPIISIPPSLHHAGLSANTRQPLFSSEPIHCDENCCHVLAKHHPPKVTNDQVSPLETPRISPPLDHSSQIHTLDQSDILLRLDPR